MASTKINGTLFNIYTGTDAGAQAAAGTKQGAATNHTISMESDMIDVTTKDSGGWEEVLPGLKSYEINVEALTTFDETQGFEWLHNAYLNRTKVYYRLSTEVTANEKFYGEGYISSMELNAPMEDKVTYSVAIKGTGALVRATNT